MNKETREIVYQKCPTCSGTGKVPKTKYIRKRCCECQDHNHGCYGSGLDSGLGNEWCVTSEFVYKDIKKKKDIKRKINK